MHSVGSARAHCARSDRNLPQSAVTTSTFNSKITPPLSSTLMLCTPVSLMGSSSTRSLRSTTAPVWDSTSRTMSAVDTETERQLVANLRPALAGRSVLIATQRLSTVEVADRAVVLDGGVIIESGTPAELLSAGGVFTQLFGEEVSAAA